MNFNIVTAVREKMGIAPFEKIDANYGADRPGFAADPFGSDNSENHYTQAATMAVLTGLYRYSSGKEGAAELANSMGDGLLPKIFMGQQESIGREVAAYRLETTPVQRGLIDGNDDTLGFMQQISKTAIGILQSQLRDEKDKAAEMQTILAGQRHNILAYLPAEILVGRTLEDNSLDDRTNKMEGPVSGLMHFIENVFAEKE
jgi:hypothetical protein